MKECKQDQKIEMSLNNLRAIYHALIEARKTIKAFHDMNSNEQWWEVYNHSPEMQKINAAITVCSYNIQLAQKK